LNSKWLPVKINLHPSILRTLLLLYWRCLYSKVSLLLFLDAGFFLAEIPPRLNTFLTVFLPSFQVFLEDLLLGLSLFSFSTLFTFISSIKSLKMLFTLFNLFEELFTHVLNFDVESLLGQGV
jgi:hypothetical protein